MYDETAALRLAILATVLVAVSPANVFSIVPSSFQGGTKWVLVQDPNVSDPPTNVIQDDKSVQVLPAYQPAQQQQHAHDQSHVPASVPVQASVGPVHQHSQVQSHVPPSVPVHVADGDVPQNQYPQHFQGQSYVPESVPVVLVNVVPPKRPSIHVIAPPKPTLNQGEADAPVDDYDTEVIESQPGLPPHYPQYEYEHYPGQHDDGQYHDYYQDEYKKPQQGYQSPRVKVTTFGLTSVPISTVHAKAPTVIEYFRKKKSA